MNQNKEKKIESSDQQSAQMVKQAIKDDQGLSAVAKDIHVTVKKGTVTLDGQVITDQQMNLAANTASAIAVDDKVKNHLEIIHPKTILKFRVALILLIGLSLFCPGAFAQGHQDGDNGRNAGTINRGSSQQGRNSTGQRVGRGNRHYYHNGNWNRNGWFGWGNPAPVWTAGVLVASLPPGYTTVVVGGNTYFYGNDTYFSQLPAGGYTVVRVPLSN